MKGQVMQEIPINKIKTNSGQIPDVPANPRTITKDKFELLKKSITEDPEFLKLNPILLYDMADGTYVALGGNQRVRACKSLGMKTIHATIVANGTDPQLVKSRIIKHNAGYGDDDWDALGNEWSDEPLTDWGLDLPEDWLEQEPEIEEDEAPEVSDEPPVSKLGEVYQLGRHRVMCADSTVKENVEKLMNGEKADMVFTDPPYGVSFQSNMRTKSEKFDVLQNDDIFITEWIDPVMEVSTGFVFIWTSWKVLKEWIEITEPIGELSNLIIWDKGGGFIGDLRRTFGSDYEIALVFHRGAELTGKRLGSVWSVGKDGSATYTHPTQKPVELAVTAFNSTTKKGDRILDVFLGSGSTLIACEQTDRTCYGMELDPRYIDVIIRRFVKFTNGDQKVIRLSDGKDVTQDYTVI